MGPKAKPKTPKNAPPPVPEIDPKEIVTELQKEFFEFQLADIEKKINRIAEREEELTAGTLELEEKIEEYKKEKGAIVAEHEQLLAAKEEEKTSKREEMLYLSDEIKIRVEQHKAHIQDLQRKFEEMVTELTAKLEELEEEVRIMEDYRQNRAKYHGDLDKVAAEMEEMEKEHQRNLFAINTKFEEAQRRVKKELQLKLLQLSIEFRQISQKRIGNPCHRVTEENKAIQGMLAQMKNEILEYEEKCVVSRQNMTDFKELMNKKEDENYKIIAKTIIQIHVRDTLLKDTLKLVEKLKEFTAIDILNRSLLRKLNSVSYEIDKKMLAMDTVNQEIADKIDETNAMREAERYLKKKSRRLVVLMRNGLKIAEQANAVRLIPMGEMEEEKHLTIERQIKLFRNRRDVVFVKKGRILQHLLDILAKAQIPEDDKKLLRGSTDSIDILADIHYSQIYGKAMLDQESKHSILKEPQGEDEKKKGPVFFPSLTSLPRSVSVLVIPEERESETESYEGEYGEYGEGYEFDIPSREEETEEEGDENRRQEEELQESQDEGDKVEEEKKSEGSVD